MEPDQRDQGDMEQPQPSPSTFHSQETDMIYSFSSDMNDYMSLKRALMNEKASPEILEFEADLLTRLTYHIEQQVCMLATLISFCGRDV